MQSRNHVYTQPGKRFKRIYPYITFGILQVRENEISLRKWRGAVLRNCAPLRENWPLYFKGVNLLCISAEKTGTVQNDHCLTQWFSTFSVKGVKSRLTTLLESRTKQILTQVN